MGNEAKDDKNDEQTVDVNTTEESKGTDTSNEEVNRDVTEDSKDNDTSYLQFNTEEVRRSVTEDHEDDTTNKNNLLNVDLKNKLIMAIVALISIVCSFTFVSKISTSFEKKDFEVQGMNSVSTIGRTKDASQKDTNLRQENKKGKTNEVSRAGVEKGNTDDINNDEETGSLMDSFVVPLESIVVNLGGIGSNRYLRIQINLEVDNEDTQKKISEKTVILRDKMISFFSTKTAEAVETEGGLFKLRSEIKDLLNKLLGSGEIIKQVYFSDFIVQ